ncbi:4'-phosphopantetheinyl transferase family protein [Pseudonocardia acaciae]|uniref:4'-phosphopantetheinyl transferase family protein n=1 Tax=Pseudonocardia acaciae TaxID=551276 RepID=UPI001FDEA75B|nr:4'-phosphopantetheinyl transferase superfamily protein [Pseudonocardia acaciae]
MSGGTVTDGAALGRILPASVVAVEMFGDDPEEATVALMPEEAAHIAGAVQRRRREYACVRHCARKGLAALGLSPVPILSGSRREPLWPAGAVGSMTHCAGYRAAAVARASEVATVGIDAEPHEPLPDGVLSVISRNEERARLDELAAHDPATMWDRLLFSAKESVYKAWYPLARDWLGFEQASIELDPVRRRFSARLLVPGPELDGTRLDGFEGRWLVRDGLLLTAIAVPRAET